MVTPGGAETGAKTDSQPATSRSTSRQTARIQADAAVAVATLRRVRAVVQDRS